MILPMLLLCANATEIDQRLSKESHINSTWNHHHRVCSSKYTEQASTHGMQLAGTLYSSTAERGRRETELLTQHD